jgi:phosphoserine phosphatase RsbU/P
VETLPQNIFRKDLQERFTFANRQFCKTLGKSLEEIVGKTDYDFFPRELAAKYQADDKQVLESRRSFETVEKHQLANGEKLFVQVVKTPLLGAQGQTIGLQGMFWDITAQKQAEERIRQANAELARSQDELRVKNLQMQDDLKMAREIQLTMLPQQYPVLPRGASPAESAFQFTHRYHPTGTVGGDFFSVSALSETEVAVFICDVAGHGVRSALVTAMVRALVEELRPHATDPGQFMTKLNSDLIAILKHSGTPVLTTAFYLVSDLTTGAIRYANAGHPKPLHLQRGANKVEWLSNAGKKSQPALGLLENAAYQTSRAALAPHDLVMLFTDGLYEVAAVSQELYTQEMLAAAAGRLLKYPAPEMFDALLAEVRAFSANGEFDDDVCLVGMEFIGISTAKSG